MTLLELKSFLETLLATHAANSSVRLELLNDTLRKHIDDEDAKLRDILVKIEIIERDRTESLKSWAEWREGILVEINQAKGRAIVIGVMLTALITLIIATASTLIARHFLR